MILTNKLRGAIAERGYSQAHIAKIIGITPKTFYEKMKIGIFNSDEIQIMINILNIENPVDIFFAKEVTLKDTTRMKGEKDERDNEKQIKSNPDRNRTGD